MVVSCHALNWLWWARIHAYHIDSNPPIMQFFYGNQYSLTSSCSFSCPQIGLMAKLLGVQFVLSSLGFWGLPIFLCRCHFGDNKEVKRKVCLSLVDERGKTSPTGTNELVTVLISHSKWGGLFSGRMGQQHQPVKDITTKQILSLYPTSWTDSRVVRHFVQVNGGTKHIFTHFSWG